MANIGRLGIAHSLKQLLELTGAYGPTIGEGMVPTIQIADLERGPFDSVTHWSCGATLFAAAAQYPYFVVVPSVTLPKNAWVTVDEIYVRSIGGAVIFPEMFATLPVLTQEVSPRNSRQGGAGVSVLQRVSEVAIFQGSSATAPPTGAMQFILDQSLRIPMRFDLGSAGSDLSLSSNSGALVVVGGLNGEIYVSVEGRVHFTTAK